MRSQFHYLATLILIAIYGVQVCPFIEGLTPFELIVPLMVIVGLQYGLRQFVGIRLIESTPEKKRVNFAFRIEWGLFILSGVWLTVNNSVFYDFPVASGIKMILGFSTLGFFAATDLALEQERCLAEVLQNRNIRLVPDEEYFPIAGKFALFAAVSSIFMVGIFFLLINKDLHWLFGEGKHISMAMAQRAVLIEFSFVGVVLVCYMLIVIFSYARNLNYFFGNENRVLKEATSGNLNTAVTVSSNDEFGVMAHHTNVMIETLLDRTQEIQLTQNVTILSLASLAEARDNETGAHILRTQNYVRCLANHLRSHPRFSDKLDDATISLLYRSAPLHDIGKVGIPDRILLKPGKLDNEEFELMKTHTSIGGDALSIAEARLGTTSFLKLAREIAMTHHEKWDGSGYPNGLKEDDIPYSGRLMALADVYDALISKRVYKEAFSHEKAVGIIKEGRGNHFDPDIVDAFLAVEHEFVEIAKCYADEGR